VPLLQITSHELPIFVWSGVLIVVLLIGFLAVQRIRDWVHVKDAPEEHIATGFTLSDLRQMHRDGKISDEEFSRARDRIIAAAKKAHAIGEKRDTRGAGRKEEGPSRDEKPGI